MAATAGTSVIRIPAERARPPRLRGLAAQFALIPAWLVVLAVYIGTMLWTVQISFTNSKLLPVNDFVGLSQYERLFATTRWLVALENMAIFVTLYIAGCLVLGFLLAVAIDQRVRGENAFRTIFLYPQAMSFIVTGLIWQWILNPRLGIQSTVRGWGFENFDFNWIVDPDRVIFVVVLAGVWHTSGLVMAILLAGLRGIDAELWKAARVDGIPVWRTYLHIIIPELKPMVVTAVVLLAVTGVKVYDLVVALTNGGPGIASEVPAKFVMDHLFNRSNIGLATAASVVMLVTVLIVLAPWLYVEHFRPKRVRPPA
jgi:glucose/mannose transport system permease protein